METSTNYWMEILKYCSWGCFFGLMGGFARILRKGVKGWLDFFAQVFVSAFCATVPSDAIICSQFVAPVVPAQR